MSYNDLIGNLQQQAGQNELKKSTLQALREKKRSMTDTHLDEEYRILCEVFHEVERDIKLGAGIDRALLKRTFERGDEMFTFFTGHQFVLKRTLNFIEDNPIFTTLHIEVPYDLKSKASMVDGIELEDCHLELHYADYEDIFYWKEAKSDKRLSEESLKEFIAAILNF